MDSTDQATKKFKAEECDHSLAETPKRPMHEDWVYILVFCPCGEEVRFWRNENEYNYNRGYLMPGQHVVFGLSE